LAAFLLANCKTSCNCGFKPPTAKRNTTWMKR
jgi:hypothetical protein